MATMDAKRMAELLYELGGSKPKLPAPASLTDEQLITEFQTLYDRRTTDETLTPNERKSATVRLRQLAQEKSDREQAAASKPTRRK